MLSKSNSIYIWQKLLFDKPWISLLIYMLVTAVLYLQASRYSIFPHSVIQPWHIDKVIPFLPSAAVIYITYFFLIPTLITLSRSRRGFRTVYATALFCGLTNLAIYILFPTALAERSAAPVGTLLSYIQAQDTVFCALPSGHVSLPTSICVAAYLVGLKSKSTLQRFWNHVCCGYAIWAAALAVSALLTGQHYMIDILAGFIFGSGFTCVVYLISKVYRATLIALLKEWLVIVVVITLALYAGSIVIYVIAGFIVSTRQHALLVLFHDAVHGLVANSNRLNDLLINATVGVPLLLPVHAYRVLHINHHKHLGSQKDPERLLLYWGQPWNYRPLKTNRLLFQFVGDISGFNSIVMATRYLMMSSARTKLDRFAITVYLDFFLLCTVVTSVVVAAFFVWPNETFAALLLWFVPYLTLTQFFQKIRSFAEHSLDEKQGYTHNWCAGVIGRLTIWPYNINYHLEHHARPNIPWDRLPTCSVGRDERPAKELIPHIWTGPV